MNLNENAYKLLRGRTDVDRSPLTLEKLRAHSNDAYLQQFARIFAEWHVRVEKHKPDCEYLVHLENANAHVMMLEAIGVVTPAFAKRFTGAVDLNVEVAMAYMTPEAREAQLRPGARQYVYEIKANDMPEDVAMASPSRYFVPSTPKKKGSGLAMDTDPMKLSAPADPDEARVPVYDRGDGLYDGLTELGRWVVVNDDANALLDMDRWKSFARFVTGTYTNMALLSAGSIVVVAAADFIPTPLRLALLGAGGFFLKRSARRALNGRWRQQAEDGVALVVAAGALEGVRLRIEDIVETLRVVLQDPEPGPWGWRQRFREWLATKMPREIPLFGYFGGGEDGVANERLATAAQRGVLAVKRVLESNRVTRFLVGALANRYVLGVGVVGATLLYYAGYHHSGRYIPNRQRYYLGINSAKRLKAQTQALRSRLDQSDDQIGVLRGRLPSVEDAKEALRRAKEDNQGVPAAETNVRNTKDDKRAGERVIKEFNEEKVRIKNRLNAIDRERAAVAPDDDDLQPACAAVDALVVRILDEKDNQVPAYIRRLDAAVALAVQDLPFWPPVARAAPVAPVAPLAPLAPVAPVAPGEALAALNAVGGGGQGASAVDEVFANLRL